MTALSHGVPVVTTIGRTTESCWIESEPVKLTEVGDIEAMVEAAESLLANVAERRRLSDAGRALYENHFDLAQTIAALQGSAAPEEQSKVSSGA
jgi:glycosyltransferase involved in cell wall biosynthesis